MTAAALSLTAANSSFVIWTTSGLENGLYVLVLSLALFLSLQNIADNGSTKSNSVVLGLVTAAAAMTRPEGIIYFVVGPILLFTKRFSRKKAPNRSDFLDLSLYTLGFVLLFGSFILFRLGYFGDIFPNTYYMKGGPSFSAMVGKLRDLASSVGGESPIVLLLGLTVAAVILTHLVSIKWFKGEHFVLFAFLGISASAFLLLPKDWMGCQRFATPFIVFFYTSAVVAANDSMKNMALKPRLRQVFGASLLVAVATGSILLFGERSSSFTRNPTVPFTAEAEDYGHRFNRYADKLQIGQASFLGPDAGGVLYYSRLRFYDLGGLCDKTIARSLDKNQEAFYDYVFEIAKPTFVHTHDSWTYLARLDNDKRFRRDYLPIFEYRDVYVKNAFGLEMYSGEYVRKDAVKKDSKSFFEVRADAASFYDK